ncbi:hypothetical protein PAXINDRAFT_17847 [Paxillus involutus ATCC 200175]|uniref:Uncharacterized protein n=1 Tax=Paxillus involutus ATCC 200175 TaxID=664439 RepID=A0A0C9SPK3_PAXIN|nr:hypothetical protein PAXINDRAFT_17847 [Paxillus involutus ATCC 200175]
MAEIPVLRTDGRNWSAWRENLERTLDELGISAYISQTTPNPYDEQANALAKCAIASTIPDSIFLRILHSQSAHEWFKTLRNLFERPTTTTGRLSDIWNTGTTREAAYSVETANDVRDTSHRDGEVSNGSGRRNDVPRNNTRRQRQRETRSQGEVERRGGECEKDSESKGRTDEKVTAAARPGRRATDQKADHQVIPSAQTTTPSPPPPTPSLPDEQTAPKSKRPTHQQSRNGHIPTRRTREDDKWSRRGVESRSQGGREPGDEDGDDVRVHHAHVEPHPPSSTRQTASNEAADTSNPSATSARPRLPAGTSRGPPNGSNENEGEKGDRVERASGTVGPSSDDDGGDEGVHHRYVVPDSTPPPYPDEPTPPPPSTPLEGEMYGEESSGRAHEAATHDVETPQAELRTTLPLRTPYDQKSSGEGRVLAIGHRQAVGEEDEVGENGDDTKTLYRVEERRSRRGEARDEAREDQEVGSREERRTAATNANNEDDAPSTPPSPQPPPLPVPNHPEQPHHVDTAKRADALHDPGGETDAPGSQPPSVRLEGEKNKASSLNVEPDNVKTDDATVEEDQDDQQTPRDPVGTPDGDERCPSEPTEPPDEKDGERETNVSSRTDEPGDEGVEESRSREVEGKEGDQSEGDGCQRDGRTNDAGDATSSASCDSLRVETGALADDEAGQQCDGKPRASTNPPEPSTPSTPPPYATKRPTHIANPPRRRGRLKTLPTNISQPERTEYTPRRTVESTTTQLNRMRRKWHRATGGVSQSHHSRGRSAPRPVRRHRTPSTSPTRELPYQVIARA